MIINFKFTKINCEYIFNHCIQKYRNIKRNTHYSEIFNNTPSILKNTVRERERKFEKLRERASVFVGDRIDVT